MLLNRCLFHVFIYGRGFHAVWNVIKCFLCTSYIKCMYLIYFSGPMYNFKADRKIRLKPKAISHIKGFYTKYTFSIYNTCFAIRLHNRSFHILKYLYREKWKWKQVCLNIYIYRVGCWYIKIKKKCFIAVT